MADKINHNGKIAGKNNTINISTETVFVVKVCSCYGIVVFHQ